MCTEHAEQEIFAVEDFKTRLLSFIKPSLNHSRFVLTHGDLRPENILVGDDLSIKAIIDWEWSSTVPCQFFTPPPWLGATDIPLGWDRPFYEEYAKLRAALTDAAATSDTCRRLAAEWKRDIDGLPKALLRHHNLTLIYYAVVFRKFYPGISRRDETREFFFDRDGPDDPFNRVVQQKVAACEAHKQYLGGGLLTHDEVS